MATQVQNRRGTTAEHSTFTGAAGEITVDTDKEVAVVHDGSTAGGYPLMRENGSNSALALGSAGTPSLKFTGDPNTGIYSPGADQLAVATNGTGRLQINNDGSIGIATGAKLGFGGLGAAPGAHYIKYDAGIDGLEFNGYAGLAFQTFATERLRITSAGLVGIGTSAPGTLTHLRGTNATTNFTINNPSGLFTLQDTSSSAGAGAKIAFGASYDGTNSLGQAIIGASKESGTGSGADQYRSSLVFHTSNHASGVRETMRLDPDGRLGIGTTSPTGNLHVVGVSGTSIIRAVGADAEGNADVEIFSTGSAGNSRLYFSDTAAQSGSIIYNHDTNSFAFATAGSERARIDSSGRLLVGTSTALTGSTSGLAKLQVSANTFNNGQGILSIASGSNRSVIGDGSTVGEIFFADNAAAEYAKISCVGDGTSSGSGDTPGRLVFSTTKDGQSSPTEAGRITSAQDYLFGCTTNLPASTNATGVAISTGSFGGYVAMSRDNGQPLDLNRKTTDGILILFKQDGTDEGSISVSGTTVSYNGAHLSRWSQLPSGQERTEILRGTVLSNLDEMCEWDDEDNEQLNRMKVSDVEGDKNVSGVFQCWDDNDDTYTNDFYCAMTGDFIIRITAGTTVERGDLLMSAGDGTAKPQDDDIIRSKTIAKVTSINVSCTYDDGSYCVPCVLMAC